MSFAKLNLYEFIGDFLFVFVEESNKYHCELLVKSKIKNTIIRLLKTNCEYSFILV